MQLKILRKGCFKEKMTEATGDSIGNKIAGNITSISSQNYLGAASKTEEILKERFFFYSNLNTFTMDVKLKIKIY